MASRRGQYSGRALHRTEIPFARFQLRGFCSGPDQFCQGFWLGSDSMQVVLHLNFAVVCRAQDHDILMKSICMLMDSSRPYSEEEVNELL